MSGYIYGETPYDTSGPYTEWQTTDANLTDAVRDDFRQALRGKRHPACPTCAAPIETLEQDSVSVQKRMYGDYEQVGTLATLHPCGHRFTA